MQRHRRTFAIVLYHLKLYSFMKPYSSFFYLVTFKHSATPSPAVFKSSAHQTNSTLFRIEFKLNVTNLLKLFIY